MKKISVDRECFEWFYDDFQHNNCVGEFKKERIDIDEYLIKHISIGITNNCNMNCTYCYKSINSDKCLYEIPYNEIVTYIEKLMKIRVKERGLETVQLIGGEPTLHKDFIKICRYLKDNGLEIRVSTNGTNSKILRSNDLKEIYVNHPMEFRISLDDFDYSKNNLTRGRKFNSITENIKYLINNGAKVSVKSVITKKNINDIPKTLEFLASLGVKAYSYSTLYNLGNASNDLYYKKNYVSDLEVFKKFIEVMDEYPEYVSMIQGNIICHILQSLFVKKPNYFLTKFYLYVNYDGNIYAQDQLINNDFIIGNIYDKTLDYNKLISNYRVIKRKYEISKSSCTKCDFYSYCVKGNYGELYRIDRSLESEFPTCKDLKKMMEYFMVNGEVSKKFLIKSLISD